MDNGAQLGLPLSLIELVMYIYILILCFKPPFDCEDHWSTLLLSSRLFAWSSQWDYILCSCQNLPWSDLSRLPVLPQRILLRLSKDFRSSDMIDFGIHICSR